MSRKRAAVARTARGARSGDGHTTPNAAAAAGVLGRSAARAGLAVPLYLEALEAGAMARLADGRDGQWPQHDLHRLLVAAERLRRGWMRWGSGARRFGCPAGSRVDGCSRGVLSLWRGLDCNLKINLR